MRAADWPPALAVATGLRARCPAGVRPGREAGCGEVGSGKWEVGMEESGAASSLKSLPSNIFPLKSPVLP